MFTTGLVSVTFRKLKMDEILTLCREAGLDAIEVGSDVHAPKEDLENCRRIAALAAEAGIRILSYGTYYKLGSYADAAAEMSAYIKAAKALGTKNLRLWAGTKNSEDADPETRAAWVKEAQLCADLAAGAGMTISFEYHGGTLTNTPSSAVQLMKEIGRPNVSLYWQPNQYRDLAYNIASLETALPYVSTIHTFAWDARSGECIRYPLADHAAIWKEYLDRFIRDGRDHALLMEFVKDDSIGQFRTDAEELRKWVKRYAV